MTEYKSLSKYPYWKFSSKGEIISLKLNRPRKLFKSESGYLMVTYKENGKTKNHYVHRLITEAFVGPIPKGMAVNHIDGDKLNNFPSNLEIVTYSENIKHADKNGLRICAYGENNSQAKLTNRQAIRLINDILHTSMRNDELGVKYDLHSRYVSLIRHKRRWKKLWEQVEGATTTERTLVNSNGTKYGTP